jgi:hypothetical protein
MLFPCDTNIADNFKARLLDDVHNLITIIF